LTTRISGVLTDGPVPKSRQVTGKSPFTSSTFEATLNDVRFLPSGEARVVLIVPDAYSDEAAELRHGYACSLKITIERLSHARMIVSCVRRDD
jgi:hypothetical protein